MNIKKVISFMFLNILIFLITQVELFNEPIALFIIYLFLFKQRNYTMLFSSIVYLSKNHVFLLKNIIFFVIFEILISVFNYNNKKSKIAVYRIFMLTFFVYLVLINIFEPMVYNFSRLFHSIYLYILSFILCRGSLISNK